jgi:L-fucose mutarotase
VVALKTLHPLLGPDLLYALAAMGHGDEIGVVDRNFPTVSMSRRVLPLLGADVVTTVRAILTLLPLDTFVPAPVTRMEVVGDREFIPDVQGEVLAVCEASEGRPLVMGSVERAEFYGRARSAFAVVATGEARPYGCVLLTKGVVSAI